MRTPRLYLLLYLPLYLRRSRPPNPRLNRCPLLPTPEPTPEPPAKPTELEVSTEPGSLDVSVDWDDVDGTSYYWVRWRSVDTGEKLNEGVEVRPSETDITVEDYGEWVVRVQACNDAGCGKPIAKQFKVEPAPDPTPGPTPSAISFSVSADSVAEDAAATDVTVTASLKDGTTRDEDTVVTLTLSGTADSSDYTASTLNSITIPAGQSSASGTLTITPVDDGIIEDSETVLLTGSAPGMGETSASISFTDPVNADGEAAKAQLSIASPSAEVEEGSNAEFTVTLSHSVAADVIVAWSVTPSTADATDYTTDAGSVTFTANSSAGATRTVAVPTKQDMLSEGAEAFTVTLGTVSGDLASRVLVDSERASAEATISESDPITVELAGPSTVSEGSATASYTVSLSPAGVVPTDDLAVSYATADGTATAGSDYTSTSGTLTFTQADHANKSFTVQTADDSLDDSDETFTVTISSPTGGGGPTPTLGTASVTTTISELATPLGFTLTVSPSSLAENAGRLR